jgi:hypothetical protein
MDLLDQSERDDFAILTVAAGFDPDDFELTAIRNLPSPTVHAVRGTVTVVRKSNSKGATYPVGLGRGWLLTFEDDLRGGAFGTPFTP